MKKLIIAWAILSFRPACAYLPPDLSLRRTELVQLLPYGQVAQLQDWVAQLPVLLSPAQFQARLYEKFADRSLAWTFYASWEYLDLLEKTQQGYDQRDDDLARAEDRLTAYIERCNESMRAEVTPAQPRGLKLDPPEGRPRLEEDEQHLRVFRPLPWPEGGYDRGQIIQLTEAARADLQQVQTQRAKLEDAKQAFVGRQDVWTAWLTDVAQSSQKYTQAQYLKPYDDPLPPAPGEPATASPSE
ncbi:hypothetical protein JST97_31095 [bacterium]|nr:hypothetical protein [bacterium]